MTRTDVYTGQLLAADTARRTLTYRLLTYGEDGYTNVGRVRVRAGSLNLPAASALVGNIEHDRLAPVARAVSINDNDNELLATFNVLDTTRGNDLLAEAAAGVRTGASVEIDEPVIRAGDVIAGSLTGVGFVVSPAFPSAGLVATEVHPDTGDDPAPEPEPEPDDDDDNDDDTEGTEMPDTDPAADVAAVTPNAAVLTAGATPARTVPEHATDAFRLMAAAAGGMRAEMSPQLRAALSDITYTPNALIHPPQWVGEVWGAAPYVRQIVPLVNHDNLTSLTINGWRWVNEPIMAPYTGDKADVPSNAVSTEAVTKTAKRYAGAHDVDRAFLDFGDDAFWSGYWSAMAASYARLSDGALLADIIAGGTAATADTLASAIMTGGLALADIGPVSFILISRDLIAATADTTMADTSAFLNRLSFGVNIGGDTNVSGPVVRTPAALPNSTVIVGTRNAVTFYELGGGAPIRVGPVDNVAKGGVDVGAFGYCGSIVNEAKGLQVVTVATVPLAASARK